MDTDGSLRAKKLSARNKPPATVTGITEGPGTAIVKASDVIIGVAD